MQTNSYTKLFIYNTPLMDVRAPIEFQRGAFPTAKNLPIMDDEQREEVGILYKQHGQDHAIQRGHELVHGKIRETRIANWVNFAKLHPNAYLYCFRGGLRSKITQQWMREAGVDIPIITGGYKALRTFLIQELETAVAQCSFTLIGGKTGSAKTMLIQQLNNGVDLEAAAYHRGSSFGRHAEEQNTQVNFENILAINFLQLKNKEVLDIVLEDEARTIGKVGLPNTLFEKMRCSPIVVIDEPYEARLERLIQEYIIDMHNEFKAQSEIEPFKHFSDYLLNGLARVQNRLGPVRYEAAHRFMLAALHLHQTSNDLSGHYDWLKTILDNYYDPMYEDQLKKREEYICFRGNYEECQQYLQHAL